MSKKPKKKWKNHQRVRCHTVNDGLDNDEEILKIQGLVRCNACNICYPYDLLNCPNVNCKHNA
jgi:hypothetical protein